MKEGKNQNQNMVIKQAQNFVQYPVLSPKSSISLFKPPLQIQHFQKKGVGEATWNIHMRGQYRKNLKGAAGTQHTPVDGKLHISFLRLNQLENKTPNLGMGCVFTDSCPPRKVSTPCVKSRIYYLSKCNRFIFLFKGNQVTSFKQGLANVLKC